MLTIRIGENVIDTLFFTASAEVDEICLPMKKLGITILNYLKNFNDGTQINFSNNRIWIEDYYKLELYRSSLFEHHPHNYETGIFLWPYNINNIQFIKHGETQFNSGNGITLIEKQPDGCEFFSFSGNINDKWLINFYINNLSVLKKFTLYFKHVFNNTLKQVEKNKIILPRLWDQLIFEEQNILSSMQDHISELQKIVNQGSPWNIAESLSNREMGVVKQLMLGKTAKEIGEFLGISYRTVEKHLENIKLKCNCNNKTKIISKLLDN